MNVRPSAKRGGAERRTARRAWALSAAVSLVWLVWILAADLENRVLEHWEAAVTMLFGSFLAGSSPEGGGAVAFPVFTKALEVPSSVARTFGLSIQAVGMTMASVAIIMNRRAIHARTAVLGSLSAVAGFLVAAFAFGQSDSLLWPSTVSTPWIKATFSIMLATTSVMMVRHLRHTDADHPLTR